MYGSTPANFLLVMLLSHLRQRSFSSTALIGLPQLRGNPFANLRKLFHLHTSRHAQAVEQVYKILSGNIACRTRAVGASSKSTHCSIESANAVLEGHD